MVKDTTLSCEVTLGNYFTVIINCIHVHCFATSLHCKENYKNKNSDRAFPLYFTSPGFLSSFKCYFTYRDIHLPGCKLYNNYINLPYNIYQMYVTDKVYTYKIYFQIIGETYMLVSKVTLLNCHGVGDEQFDS